MSAFEFKNPRFLKTAMAPKHYPKLKDDSGQFIPEIAVAGRSNVGKSSLLNHLFQRHGLVKTSSTPGKTQAINFFTLDEKLTVVDLPGYGYAKVPESVRRHWGPMVQAYLQQRPQLHLILFLLDIRRTPNDDDRRFLEWVIAENKAVILVVTKIDKVTRNVRRAKIKKLVDTLGIENLHHVEYSVTKNLGRKQLVSMINDALRDELEGDDETDETEEKD